jgi:hypothetical protein
MIHIAAAARRFSKMPRRKRNGWSEVWKLWPAPSVRVAVENLVNRESAAGRPLTVAAMVEQLVVEALHHRVAAADNVVILDPFTRI